MIRRTPDWDNSKSLDRVAKSINPIVGRSFQIEHKGDMARLWILPPGIVGKKTLVTDYMVVAELRGVLEGMATTR